LMSPTGTRSTLLHNRPSDFSSSGFTNWPFMTTHSWGESPLGKWTLEIHNDAYSSWVSDAKFFRWSLKLYGTQSDPNSENTDDHAWYDEEEDTDTDWKENVVREAPLESTTTSTTEWTASPTTSTTTPTPAFRSRGCISTTIECTKDVAVCRMFEHRKVAGIFCRCVPHICIGVAFSRNDAGDYNLQCNVDSKPRSLSPKRPFYCQFIPFFDTKKRWQTTTTSTTTTTTTTTSIRDKEWWWWKLNSSTVHTVNYFIFPLTYEKDKKWRDIHFIIDEEEKNIN